MITRKNWKKSFARDMAHDAYFELKEAKKLLDEI